MENICLCLKRGRVGKEDEIFTFYVFFVLVQIWSNDKTVLNHKYMY